jgi:hypothetical protein
MINDQLDPQFFFLICLFQSSTCFGQPRAHHQENHLYQYSVWYMSLYVGDRLDAGRERNEFLSDLRTRQSPTQSDIPDADGFGGLVVCVLASGSRVRGFEPGRSRWIFSV